MIKFYNLNHLFQHSKSNNGFLPIRLLLAILVIYFHSFPICGKSDYLSQIDFPVSIGEIAVNSFLVISGFLVSHSWFSSKSTKSYLIKRIFRIYPAFIVLSIIQAIIFAPLAANQSFLSYTFKQIGILIFEVCDLVGYGFPYGGLFDVFPNNPVPGLLNASLWMIRYEFICYLTLPLLLYFSSRSNILIYIWFSMNLFFYVTNIRLPWHWILTAVMGDFAFLPGIFTYFYAGVLIYLFRSKLYFNLLSVIFYFGLLVTFCMFNKHLVHLLMVSIGSISIIFLCLILKCPSKLQRIDISFGVYIYGWPIQQFIICYIGSAIQYNPYLLFVTALPIAVIFGSLSWFLIESRFLRMIKK